MKLRDPLPELTGEMEWLHSRKLIKEELIGHKPILIYFWSISCKSCQNGIERIKSLFKQYQDKLQIVTVHIPRSEEDRNIDRIQAWMDHNLFHFPVIVDQKHMVVDRFQNRYVPAFYLFDQKGELRYFQSGNSNPFILRKRMERLLAELE